MGWGGTASTSVHAPAAPRHKVEESSCCFKSSDVQQQPSLVLYAQLIFTKPNSQTIGTFNATAMNELF